MALIPYPNIADLPKDVREILETVPLNVVRMMSGMGASFKPLMSLVATFYNHGVLSPALRELLTLRIGHRLNAAYMLDQHQAIARAAGVGEAQMTAIAGPLPSAHFSEAENAAIILADNLVDNVRAPEPLVSKVYDLLGEAALHELFVVSGFCHLMGRYMESLRVELDGGAMSNHADQLRKMSEQHA